MVTMEKCKRKTLQCEILTLENKTGFTLSSRQNDDDKLVRLLALYSRRGHNIYPIYNNGMIDNVTIDEMPDFNNSDVAAYFITLYKLDEVHSYSEAFEDD